jgi:hypothetical protein
MYFWLSMLRPKTGLYAGLIVLAIFGCTKSSKNKGVVSVSAASQQKRPQTASLDVGSTTKDTAAACRGRSKKEESEESDEDSSGDDSDDASDLRLADDKDTDNARGPSVNVGGNSVRAAEDAEAIVSKQCKSCHGGSGSTSNNNNNQSRNQGGLLGRFRRNNNNNVVRSDIKFGGREDLEVRANDIIEEFENPGRQHSSISNPDAVVKAFEDLKRAKERRLEKQANNCI